MSYRSTREKLSRGWKAWKCHFAEWWGPYVSLGLIAVWFGVITLIWYITEG